MNEVGRRTLDLRGDATDWGYKKRVGLFSKYAFANPFARKKKYERTRQTRRKICG